MDCDVTEQTKQIKPTKFSQRTIAANSNENVIANLTDLKHLRADSLPTFASHKSILEVTEDSPTSRELFRVWMLGFGRKPCVFDGRRNFGGSKMKTGTSSITFRLDSPATVVVEFGARLVLSPGANINEVLLWVGVDDAAAVGKTGATNIGTQAGNTSSADNNQLVLPAGTHTIALYLKT